MAARRGELWELPRLGVDSRRGEELWEPPSACSSSVCHTPGPKVGRWAMACRAAKLREESGKLRLDLGPPCCCIGSGLHAGSLSASQKL